MSFDLSTEEVIVGRTESDIKKYGKKGTGFLAKVVMSSGENPVLGRKILVDLAKPHVVLICGKRGGGKSYSMSVFVEGFAQLPPEIRTRMAVLVIDTVGIFWSMKMPNTEEANSLYDWGLQPEGMGNLRVLVPMGKYDFYKKNNH